MEVIKNKMQKIAATGILFFADRLPPLIGGMEVHANYFIKYFSNHKKFPILKVVTKNSEGQDAVLLEGSLQPIDLITLAILVKPAFIFLIAEDG